MNTYDKYIFKHPFNCMIAGPSQSGKSTLIKNIINNKDQYIYPSPKQIYYCYNTWSPEFEKIQGTIFIQGISNDFEPNSIVILDDLMPIIEKNKKILDLFTTKSHHSNLSIFFLTHNLFSNGKNARTIALNCQYLIIMNNPRDKNQIYYLSRQMYPNNPKFLVEAYEDATKSKYGYLFLDLSQSTQNEIRVQTNITSNKRIVYTTKF